MKVVFLGRQSHSFLKNNTAQKEYNQCRQADKKAYNEKWEKKIEEIAKSCEEEVKKNK